MKTLAAYRSFSFIALFFFIFSCADKKQPDVAGVWEIEELKITMNSYRNSDSSRVPEATGKNWEEKMKVRNIQTYYNPDGTYHSVHKTLQDSIFYDPAGTWKIENDTITIQDTIPARITYRFKVKVDQDVVEYWGVQDFDQDGKPDDDYYSKQRRINKL